MLKILVTFQFFVEKPVYLETVNTLKRLNHLRHLSLIFEGIYEVLHIYSGAYEVVDRPF